MALWHLAQNEDGFLRNGDEWDVDVGGRTVPHRVVDEDFLWGGERHALMIGGRHRDAVCDLVVWRRSTPANGTR